MEIGKISPVFAGRVEYTGKNADKLRKEIGIDNLKDPYGAKIYYNNDNSTIRMKLKENKETIEDGELKTPEKVREHLSLYC